MTALASAAAQTARVMSIILGAIASGMLLAGGIGIMNIMLVSAAERTGEIGRYQQGGVPCTDGRGPGCAPRTMDLSRHVLHCTKRLVSTAIDAYQQATDEIGVIGLIRKKRRWMMKSFSWRSCVIAMCAVGIALASSPSAAQQSRTVAGLVVNLGIVPAEVALTAEGHREAHPLHPPSGSQHLLITLDEEKTGKRIGDAEVAIEITDPHGGVERKPLLHTQAGGLPDYSELFRFGWSGEYSIRVVITRPGAKPIEAHFTVNHVI